MSRGRYNARGLVNRGNVEFANALNARWGREGDGYGCGGGDDDDDDDD